jgi:hypothetical protein
MSKRTKNPTALTLGRSGGPASRPRMTPAEASELGRRADNATVRGVNLIAAGLVVWLLAAPLVGG